MTGGVGEEGRGGGVGDARRWGGLGSDRVEAVEVGLVIDMFCESLSFGSFRSRLVSCRFRARMPLSFFSVGSA